MKIGGKFVACWLLAIVAGIGVPSTVEADIVSRDLGVDDAGDVVTGYVFQSGRGRGGSASSISRRSRLGPRVSSGYGSRNFFRFGGRQSAATVVPVMIPFGVRYCRTASYGLARLGFRAVNVGGRFSFTSGF
jgi:hypothetical protein